MALPSPHKVKELLASSRKLRSRILSIAKRLEALNEYHRDQALIVAADIVLNAMRSHSSNSSEKVGIT